MATNWTIQATESVGDGQSSIYIDFIDGSNNVYTPDTINETNGGVVLTRPMVFISSLIFPVDNIVSASANDFVNLNGLSSRLYCRIFQTANSNNPFTVNIINYNMSLTFTEIGSGNTGPVGITGGTYSP
jgi:hypothetical protein